MNNFDVFVLNINGNNNNKKVSGLATHLFITSNTYLF